MTNSKESTPAFSLDNERLVFNGHTHYVVGVLGSVSSSERVGIAIADTQIDEPSELDLVSKVAIPLPKTAPTEGIIGDRVEILVYKHNNRFYVLAGHDRVRFYRAEGKTHYKAKIVSSPALKKTRVIEQAPTPIRSIDDRRPSYGTIGHTRVR